MLHKVYVLGLQSKSFEANTILLFQVYKVYLSAIKCLHSLIVSTREAEGGDDKSWLRPILQSIFLKVRNSPIFSSLDKT